MMLETLEISTAYYIQFDDSKVAMTLWFTTTIVTVFSNRLHNMQPLQSLNSPTSPFQYQPALEVSLPTRTHAHSLTLVEKHPARTFAQV